MAEKLWINANKYSGNDDIRFSICRYGNVCGSAGSVVPVWKKLIEQGATELPITHEDCTRYWFEMPKVMEFVDNSLSKMQGGEIFIPELPSIRITDLASAFGLPYKVVGLRDNEKIHETMGVYKDGVLQDSGNNKRFLTVEQIEETIKEI
jgi:UDP-N-acetylglucosamine 4,6-dehydratase